MESSSPNPYFSKVADHPRILVNHSARIDENDIRKVREIQSKYKQCYIELGSGSGMHLIELAKRNPDKLCIGFELRYKRAYKTVEKAERVLIDNLYVLRVDYKYLGQLFPKESVDGIYVNFPDPWDKRRWHKNRVISKAFFDVCNDLLTKDGFISYKTDHKQYFESSLKLIDEIDYFKETAKSFDLYESPLAESTIPTEFECLFRSKGLPIYFIELKRI